MKKRIFFWLMASIVFSFISVVTVKKIINEQSKKEIKKSLEQERAKRKERKAAFSEARARYDFEMLKDPATGKIPAGIFEKEIAFAKNLPKKGTVYNPSARLNGITALNTYIPVGPNNVGGRTRALAYDLRFNGSSNQVIMAGSVSSGVMRSSDGGTTWNKVSPEEDNHSFTVIAQDPRAGFQDTWYAAGGEPYGNTTSEIGATYLGHGLWKSTNNGISWTKLALNNVTDLNGTQVAAGTLETFDQPFDYVHKIAINPVNGDVYVAGHRRLLRSTNGGASFQTVFGSTMQANAGNGQMDVAVNSTGRIFLAVNGGNPDINLKGIWLSNTGNANSFTRIAGGQILAVDSIPNWRGNDYGNNSKRVLLALAPSNQNTGYIFYENGLSSSTPASSPEADLFRFDIAGNTITWSNRSANMPDFPASDLEGSDPLTVQNGYDMLVAVKPDDPNTVFIGGTNLYRSTDGFASSNNTAWINGYSTSFTYQQYPNGHPDQHVITFNPSNFNQAIIGDDGGIRAGDISANSVAWTPLPNYQTLQYYYVAIDPQEGKNNFAGGAQDNGVLLRDKARVMGTALADSNNHVRLRSGDGGAVGLSISSRDQFLYGSSQLGEIRRIRLTSSFSSTDINPDNLTTNDEGGFGEFVTNLRLNPDNTEDLYYTNFNRLFRTASASTVSSSTWTELTGIAQAVNPGNPGGGKNIAIRALAFTRGSYNNTHSLFLGTTNGKIFRLDDPRNAAASATPINITPAGLTGNLQDIAVNPVSDNEIMAVVSNYNVVSIWWTNNAKSSSPTWRNVEGNLTLPSIRSCQIVINTSGVDSVAEYYVGTSVGLYSSTNVGSGSPLWQREGDSRLGYAVVQSIAHRPVDNTLLIGTHGNGMFYTVIGSKGRRANQGTEVFIQPLTPTLTTGTINYMVGNLTTVSKIVVRLFNTQGQLLFKEERGYDNASININRYPAGVYIVSIISDDGKYKLSEKIFKQ